MSDSLKFTCPKCEDHRLEEIMSDVTVASEIAYIDPEGDHNYGEQTNMDGNIECYQCINCGYVLEEKGVAVNDCQDLTKWILRHCKQGE